MNSDNFFEDNQIIKKTKYNEKSRQSRNIDGYQYCDQHYQEIHFQIEYCQGDSITYIKDGQILLKDWINDNFSDQQIITNFDFLRYLLWDGQYHTKQKIGRWTPYWKGNRLDAGGIYNEEGLKIGKWIEPVNMFGETDRVNFVGLYKQGIRVRNWQYFLYYYHHETKKFILHFKGGGYFNDSGNKQGKWIELIEGFTDESEIISYGEYKDGKKIGIWDTYFNKNLLYSSIFIQISVLVDVMT
ncbi:unnamed protein product [Paramecium primaurelia]|uniref:MORN repeat protein n=1 Tax=Paramecium primaurelia TaxID=5886 RepID=A0A8S1LFW0_PARPR|nr:unnamed protein product [Paramecium primaurelia]